MNDIENHYGDDFWAGNSKMENPRLGFVRKVYGILAAQLTLTVVVCAFAMATSESGFGFFLNTHYWLTWVWLAISICSIIPLICFSREVPLNYTLLATFTLAEALLVAQVCAIYAATDGGMIVLTAAIMTLGITLSLTLYACTTKSDFTMSGGILFVLLTAFILFGLFAWFSGSRIMNTLYCTLGVILYGIYLIYDTQLLIGGKRHSLSMDDYILGAVMLYIDIIGIFLYVLELLSKK